MNKWRFDQGRLNYFQFDEIKQIAKALITIEGIQKPRSQDTDVIRLALKNYSKNPFLPTHYKVWRNYKRVFGFMFLATDIENHIVCTDLCKKLANDTSELNSDDYLLNFAKKFYYPSPIFEDYDINSPQIFPVVATIKFLFANYLKKKDFVSVNEVRDYLIGNNVTGLENIDFYQSLKPRNTPIDIRQPREFIKFISQLSFLKWNEPNLYLEVENEDEIKQILHLITPDITLRFADPNQEVLRLGKDFKPTSFIDLTTKLFNVPDIEFAEGNKVRITHLRTERSTKLRDFFFLYHPNPHICDMCSMDTLRKYPWADRIVELHHLLPLSSPLRVEEDKTSLKDIVGLCPTCHRATHKFYSYWLKQNKLKDFREYEEAIFVYQQAKMEVKL